MKCYVKLEPYAEYAGVDSFEWYCKAILYVFDYDLDDYVAKEEKHFPTVNYGDGATEVCTENARHAYDKLIAQYKLKKNI